MRIVTGLFVMVAFAWAQQYPGQYPGQYPPSQYPPGQYPPGQYPGGQGGGLPIPRIGWPKRKPKEEKKKDEKSEAAVAESEINGKLVKLSEKELVLDIDEGKEQKFRLLAKTKFENEDGEAVRDSLLQPGDRLSVRVAEIDPETAIRVVRISAGSGPGAGPGKSGGSSSARSTNIAAGGSNEELIETAREAAKSFRADLADYTADMAVTRFYSPSSPPKWQEIDVATARVVRKDGREDLQDVLVNGKPWPRPSEHVKEWAVEEIFGTLDVVLLPGVPPSFVKRGTEKMGGKVLTLYEASVKAEDSNWVVATEDGSRHKSAYKARVWVDPESRRVFKLEQKAVGLPASFMLDRSETMLEFGFVKVGSGTVLAPVHGENIACRRGGSCSKSAVEFKNYR